MRIPRFVILPEMRRNKDQEKDHCWELRKLPNTPMKEWNRSFFGELIFMKYTIYHTAERNSDKCDRKLPVKFKFLKPFSSIESFLDGEPRRVPTRILTDVFK
jgi:hypothetical protein